MAGRRRILLYGNSVILGCLGASLERLPQFEVVHLSPSLPAPVEIDAMAPDVIVFDMESGMVAEAFSVLETRPHLLLLGVSPDGNLVSSWSGRQYRELSTEDLASVIEAGAHSSGADHAATLQHRTKEV